MGKIAIRAFTGEIPKSPTHLLPDTGAQRAVNCDFTHGDLRPLRTGKAAFPIGFPARTVYSDDGNRFVAFPDVAQAYKSPTIDDLFRRFYYTDSTGLYVSSFNDFAQTGVRRNLDIPRKKVGVPKPFGSVSITSTAVQLTMRIPFTRYKGKTSTVLSSGVKEVSSTFANNKYTFTFDLTTTEPAPIPEVTVLDSNFFAELIARLAVVVGGGDRNDTVDALYKPEIITPLGTFPISFRPGTTDELTSIPGGATITQTISDTRLYTVTIELGVLETFALAFTQTNQYGEESAPQVTDLFSVRATDRVSVAVSFTRSSDYVGEKSIVIYKTNPSGSGFVGVKEYVVGRALQSGESFDGTTYRLTQDVLAFSNGISNAIGGLTTTSDIMPPDGLQNLVLMPNGFFAASKGNTLYFSEPFRPHAWNNSMTFPHDIRGLALGEQQLVVTTAANPYIVIGVSPDSMTQQRLPDIQGGITSQSMTNSNGVVAYLSRDGIVTVNGPTSSLRESQALFTREDWRSRYDSVLPVAMLTNYDGRLFVTNRANNNAFLMQLEEGQGNYTQMELQTDAVTIVPKVDSVYYSQNSTLFEFGTGDYMTAVWHSKEFILPRPSSFAAGFINSNGSVLVELFNDNGLFSSQTVTGRTTFRIKSGQPSRRWSIRLTTKATVKEFLIAESMRDLQNG